MESEFNKVVYAEYSMDLLNVRLQSSSGGAFYSIAKLILEKDGIVFGVILDKNRMIARYSDTDHHSINEIMRSKYIAAELGNTFLRVEEELKNNRLVLFSGTPCVVAGLKNYIQKKCKDKEENLLLVDFLCAGVPSPKVFASYLETLEKKYKDRVCDVLFRSKAYGWNCYCMKVIFKSGRIYAEPYIKDSYISGFIELLFNRPSCYKCKFREKKCSDITVSDFWNVDKILPEWSKNNFGISAVFVNTKKGEYWLMKQKNVMLHKLDEDASKLAYQHLNTSNVIVKRNLFMHTWLEEGYHSAVKKYCNIYMKKSVKERLGQLKYYLKLKMRYWHMRMLTNGKRQRIS